MVLFFCVLLCPIITGQSLLPVYEGKVKPKFELVWEINSESENYTLGRITDIEIDSKGNIYAYDKSETNIKVFDNNGSYKNSILKKGRGPGEILSLNDFYIDPSDNIFLTDWENSKITNVTSGGKYKKSYQVNLFPEEIFLNKKGEIIYLQNSRKKTMGLNDLWKIDGSQKTKKIESLFIEEYFIDYNSKFSSRIPFSSKYFVVMCKDGSIITLNTGEFIFKKYEINDIQVKSYTHKSNRIPIKEKDIEYYLNLFSSEKSKLRAKKYLKFPTHKAFVSDFFIDDQDFLLAKCYSDDKSFFVFDSELNFVNKVELPENIFNSLSVFRNKYIYTIENNAEELPVIRKYKITF